MEPATNGRENPVPFGVHKQLCKAAMRRAVDRWKPTAEGKRIRNLASHCYGARC
jgi:hypothetical protein